MILLDTNALIWLLADHRRARPLLRGNQRLYVSPVSLLELRFLEEAGRIRLRLDADLFEDPRFAIDDPSALDLFGAAFDLAWTRDPFDRLLAAHAQLRRWRLATADGPLLERLGPSRTLEL
ncbi:MAG TPA: PIN domain-containing protein [Polyangia bacterium]|nr:PIN domain-containing protein [Polyangia bacterium]